MPSTVLVLPTSMASRRAVMADDHGSRKPALARLVATRSRVFSRRTAWRDGCYRPGHASDRARAAAGPRPHRAGRPRGHAWSAREGQPDADPAGRAHRAEAPGRAAGAAADRAPGGLHPQAHLDDRPAR